MDFSFLFFLQCRNILQKKKSHLSEQKPKPPKTSDDAKSPVYVGPVYKCIVLAPCCLRTLSIRPHLLSS